MDREEGETKVAALTRQPEIGNGLGAGRWRGAGRAGKTGRPFVHMPGQVEGVGGLPGGFGRR